MGEMADYLNDEIEKGESLVLDLKTKEEFWVDNMELMYTALYDDESKYKILEEH